MASAQACQREDVATRGLDGWEGGQEEANEGWRGGRFSLKEQKVAKEKPITT